MLNPVLNLRFLPEKKLIKFAICKDLLKTDLRMRIKMDKKLDVTISKKKKVLDS